MREEILGSIDGVTLEADIKRVQDWRAFRGDSRRNNQAGRRQASPLTPRRPARISCLRSLAPLAVSLQVRGDISQLSCKKRLKNVAIIHEIIYHPDNREASRAVLVADSA